MTYIELSMFNQPIQHKIVLTSKRMPFALIDSPRIKMGFVLFNSMHNTSCSRPAITET